MTPNADLLFEQQLSTVYRRTSQLFFGLLLVQWALAILLALLLAPFTWEGTTRHVHPHVVAAIFVGGTLNSLPLVLLRIRPASVVTRHVVAATQMLWSALLIHITGGRIETHFHIFGSLAFVAFYRDWKLLVTATLTVAADHLVRGFWWPESVYGIANPEWWRFAEHAAWVAFEDIVLVLKCQRQIHEMRALALREAMLAAFNSDVERQVLARTAELKIANQSLAAEMKTRLQMEAELRQAQKLESVGRLASGVAHEINTPVQFVNDSLHFLRESATELLHIVDKLHAAVDDPGAAAEARQAEEAADLPYIVENMPKAFDRSLEGLGRVASIVRSMKEFAHPDAREMSTVDLNRAVESTLIIARNEYKYVADIETRFGELPHVACFVGDVNQAVLNIVVNAAHAIGEAVQGSERRGKITVETRREGDDAVIAISDTGGGIPAAIRERIFDPFFTTKDVGKGTGQGLAIARSVIVDKHKGALTVDSHVGEGSTFVIRLPIQQHAHAEAAA